MFAMNNRKMTAPRKRNSLSSRHLSGPWANRRVANHRLLLWKNIKNLDRPFVPTTFACIRAVSTYFELFRAKSISAKLK